MKGNKEEEYKTLVTKEQFYRLADNYKPLKFIKQLNHYYVSDDPSHYAFRIREKEDKKIFTMKEPCDGARMEYEKELDTDIDKDVEIVEMLKGKGLQPPYELLGDMTTYRAIYFDGYGELCFDINLYNDLIDYEIEYEKINERDGFKEEFINILKKADIDYEPSSSEYHRYLKTKGR